jgi:zinc-ribbon domain
MELGAIFLLLGVLLIVVLFVMQPFSKQWHVKIQTGQELSVLQANRENALNALQELEADFNLGKVPEAEYTAQRASLLKAGADVLRRLDEIQHAQPAIRKEPVNPPIMESPISHLADDDLEGLIAKRRAVRQQKAAGFCPRCGKPILQSDRFCPACGKAVNSQ